VAQSPSARAKLRAAQAIGTNCAAGLEAALRPPSMANWIFLALSDRLGGTEHNSAVFVYSGSKMQDERVRTLSPEALDELLRSAEPALIDFWAPWCQPCKLQDPALEEFSERVGRSIAIAKVDIEAHPLLAKRFGIRGIPCIVAFADGKEVGRRVGLQTVAKLNDFVSDIGFIPHAAKEVFVTESTYSAFHGDAACKEFLVDRLIESARKGALHPCRAPTWLNGRGDASGALAHQGDADAFSRATGLPPAFSYVLTLAAPTTESEINNLFSRISVGENHSPTPGIFLRRWLSSGALGWDLFLSPAANALRLAWLNAYGSGIAHTDELRWRHLRDSARALQSDADDAMVEDDFARFIESVSPPPPVESSAAWAGALGGNGFSVANLLAQHLQGWSTAEISTERFVNSWLRRECPHPESLDREAMAQINQRIRDQLPDYFHKRDQYFTSYVENYSIILDSLKRFLIESVLEVSGMPK